MGIPVVFLDNAYNGFSTERFIRLHGPMADGIILTGASSQFMAKPPPHLCQVAPFVDTSTSRADDFLRTELGLDGHHLITVLAYDNKVERIGVSLLERLEGREAEWLFVSRQPEVCCERIGVYLDRGKRARVISQPPDSVLFGLIGFSKLAIVKYGFMQVTECLSLRTPVIVGYHEGPTWLNLLPESSRGFAHVTSADFADDATLDAAQRFLGLPPDAMDAIHDGRFAAAAQAADFIEQLPRTPRSDTTAECLEQGFTRQALVAALRSAFPDHSVALGALRSMLLRERPDHDTFALLCDCLVDDQQRAVRLWGHRYASEGGLVQEAQAAAEQGRKVLHVSAADRVLIEADVGQAMLPPI
jgi:hypothetical protein